MNEKIPVMIVDDEKLALEDFSTLVDWDALGFQIVAKAFNGKQALSRFQQYHPQIVFTDIKMPIIDGIVLCQELRKLDADVKLLLLTAYEDFAYAKAAISLGVTDYIIKSEINRRSLTAKLVTLREQIDRQSQHQNILMDKLVESYLADRVPEMEYPALFQKHFIILLVEQAVPLNLSGEPMPTGYLISQGNMVGRLGQEDFAPFRRVAACQTEGQRVLVALETQEASLGNLRQQLQRLAAILARTLRETFSRRFTVYWSQNPQSLRQWKENARTFQNVYSRRYFSEDDLPAICLELSTPMPAEAAVSPDLQRLRNLLAAREEVPLAEELRALFEAVAQTESVPCLNNVARDVYSFVRSAMETLPAVSARLDVSLENNLECWRSSGSIRDWAIRCLHEILHEQQIAEERRYSPAVSMTIQYVHKHYMRVDLSLLEIAQSVQISMGYLCTLFKQETGTTLRRYISDVRIDEAKKLLSRGNKKVNEVYTAVGYSSSQYFSQAFFKLVGVYPNEYRKGEVPKA